jgi:Ribbon-helix-helix protein, copG family
MQLQTPHRVTPEDDTGANHRMKGWLVSSHSVNISARFPESLIREAQRLSEEEDRSVSWQLRQALKERLERQQPLEQRPA